MSVAASIQQQQQQQQQPELGVGNVDDADAGLVGNNTMSHTPTPINVNHSSSQPQAQSRTRSVSRISAHSHKSASLRGSPPFTPASVTVSKLPPQHPSSSSEAAAHSRSRASSRQHSSPAASPPLSGAHHQPGRQGAVAEKGALPPSSEQTFASPPAPPLAGTGSGLYPPQKSPQAAANDTAAAAAAAAGAAAGEPTTAGFYNGEPLNPDANLYVANLPGAYTDQDLHDFFAKYGEIVRYAVKSTGNPRAYGFVQFKTELEAQKAIEDTNGMDVNSGQPLSVSIALQHKNKPHPDAPPTNLYIRGLPPEFRKGDLDDLFAPHGQIVQSRVVDIGVGFVRYDTNRSALDAIEKLNGTRPPNASEGERLLVKFANPSPARSRRKSRQTKFGEPLMAGGVGAFGQQPQAPGAAGGAHFPLTADNSQNLYCRGLPGDLTKVQLEKLFGNLGSLTSTKLVGNGVAFVRFDHPAHAEQAIRNLNGVVIRKGAEPLLVKLANSDPAKTHPNFMHSLSTAQSQGRFGTGLQSQGGGSVDHSHHQQQQEQEQAQRARRLSHQQQAAAASGTQAAGASQSVSRRESTSKRSQDPRYQQQHMRRPSASQRHPPPSMFDSISHQLPYSMGGAAPSPMYTHPALAQHHHAMQHHHRGGGWIGTSPMGSPTTIHPTFQRYFDSPTVAHPQGSSYPTGIGGPATPQAQTPTLSMPNAAAAGAAGQQTPPQGGHQNGVVGDSHHQQQQQQQQQQPPPHHGGGVPPTLAQLHQMTSIAPFTAPSPQSPHPSLPLPFYAPLSWKHGYAQSPGVYAPNMHYTYQVPYQSATPQPVPSTHAAASSGAHQYFGGRHSAAPHYQQQHMRSQTPLAGGPGVTPASSPPPSGAAPPASATPTLPQMLVQQHRTPPAQTTPLDAQQQQQQQQQQLRRGGGGVVQPHPVYASQTVSAEDLLSNQLSNLNISFDAGGATAQGENSAAGGQGAIAAS